MNKKAFLSGLRDGLPIGLGYIAVSFSLGIYARQSGVGSVLGFIVSILNHASAGEYSGYLMIIESATLLETVFVIAIANLRYLLMGCALSQKIPEHLGMLHRFFIGFFITDEIFAATISRKEYFSPLYVYGLAAVALPMWAAGTAIGIAVGNILPVEITASLSVALYGMFIAVIVPAAKNDRHVLALITVSFLFSYLLSKFSTLSSGSRTILLTVALSAVAAILFPVQEEPEDV